MPEKIKIIEKKGLEACRETHNMHLIGIKWVYRTKMNVDGYVNKLKVRLVVQGLTLLNSLLH